ncbi:MAG: GNAT family N-acetyltransferase [Rhodobacterales bacterium]|nr:GNAT family N-acetyltransferase [Rhodobacterales bacterium]MDX5499609.1 GNAT family N-acetyltransferase [Rhodobacterales bacterium]
MADYFNELGQPIGAPLTTALPRPRPPRTPMQGRWCAVVPLDPDAHAAALYAAYAADREGRIWTYLPTGPFADLAAYRAWMDQTCLTDDPLFHTILVEGRPLGVASLMRIDPTHGVIEVGHINFSPALSQTRAATEAMFLMMSRAFDELGYRRYEWKCDALNAPSRRAALRLGFTYEGTFRQATTYKGRNRDTAWFAITDGDWPRLKAGFQAWLDPANFDASGQQHSRLHQG